MPHSSLKIAKQKYTHKQNMGRVPITKVYAFTRCGAGPSLLLASA